MVKYIIYCLIALIALCFTDGFNQQGGIKKNKKDLSKLKEEINALEVELKNKSAKERESSAAIENYSKQTHILNRILDELQEQEQETEQEIDETMGKVQYLESKIAELKINYSKYVVSIYKYGKSNELALLYSSDSFNQAVLRFKYLRMFSQRRSNDLSFLRESKAQLIILKNELEQDKQERISLAEDKQREEKNYENKITESKRILTVIKKDKEEVKKLIASKRAAEERIRTLIAKSIEEDNRKKQIAEDSRKKKELAEKKRRDENELALLNKKKGKATENLTKKNKDKDLVVSTKTKNIENKQPNLEVGKSEEFNYSSGALFSSLRGKLNWPVSGKLFGKYGENRNEQLNTISLNYGIDILANSDLNVKAVAEGVVSVIDWIVGYGSVVIVTHRGGYRTVYSHLAGIHVKEGDRIKAGTIIGRVGESVEGNLLHFEVWSERNNQNPELWLAKK
ncbi:MAG: peptidoglycan DD-metalloendopeptidase family protein [Bacteroidota bacterium]|nr:peptidoglycan DD-metalloendopeptidase family protein [Bacteroidota bacterium]